MNSRKKRILVVDDEEKITRGIRKILELTGEFEVKEENRATHAVITTREFQPDVILLDVIMPDVQGGEVASDIREIPKFREIPIVFLTARAATAGEIEKGHGYIGRDRFLHKPVAVQDLVDCLHEELQKPLHRPIEIQSAEDPIPHIPY